MKHSIDDKIAFMNMTLDDKIKRTKQLIMEWNAQFNGKVYVSFSGGKDSTVLLHIARHTLGCENIVGVFDDTGLEYPEIRDFVKKQDNIIWIKPKKTFLQVINEYGYPIISKEQSRFISDIRSTKTCDRMRNIRLNGSIKGGYKISEKWKPLINADFKISNRCCDVMKKTPFKRYEKESGNKPIIATMADESNLRFEMYMRGDCNEYSAKHPKSKPMSFWNEQDVLQYIRQNNIEIASCYGQVVEENGTLRTTGCKRTGCMFCMYGLHLEKRPNRFDMMQVTHPKLYDYIMNKLNGAHVINEYLKCDAKCAEPDMFEGIYERKDNEKTQIKSE